MSRFQAPYHASNYTNSHISHESNRGFSRCHFSTRLTPLTTTAVEIRFSITTRPRISGLFQSFLTKSKSIQFTSQARDFSLPEHSVRFRIRFQFLEHKSATTYSESHNTISVSKQRLHKEEEKPKLASRKNRTIVTATPGQRHNMSISETE